MARECTVSTCAIQVDSVKVDGNLVAANGTYTTHASRANVEVVYSGRITCNSRVEPGGGCQACAYFAVTNSTGSPNYRYAETIFATCGNFNTFTFTELFDIGYGIGAAYYQGANTTESWEISGAIYGEYEGFEGFYCRDTPELSGNSLAAGSQSLTLTFIFDIGP